MVVIVFMQLLLESPVPTETCAYDHTCFFNLSIGNNIYDFICEFSKQFLRCYFAIHVNMSLSFRHGYSCPEALRIWLPSDLTFTLLAVIECI